MNRSFSSIACLVALSTATSLIAQEKPNERPMLCPFPTSVTTGAASLTPIQNQFPASIWAVARGGLNETAENKMVLHTFQWKDAGCCKVMGAKVTIRMKSLATATSRTASDAGNDSYGLWNAGASLAGSGGFIWPIGTPVGTVVTKTIVLTPAMLMSINGNNMLSVVVQDDTQVQSMQVQLDRCCLEKPR